MKHPPSVSIYKGLLLLVLISHGFVKPHDPISVNAIRFAVIGDYGDYGNHEADVAALVKGWEPDFVITVGDNNYPDGKTSTIDQNIGQYYHEFIDPYIGKYGSGASTNRFFPALGNHDWDTPHAQAYLDYFSLPGNERYYDFVEGPVHFFVVDSDKREPDGITSTSIQAQWLQHALAESTSPWNLVYMHHPPFSSGKHGSNKDLQWPYAEWGADAVLSGHDHIFERIVLDGIPYFVNGLGGSSKYSFKTPLAGSRLRYNDDYGAMLVSANETEIVFQFITHTGLLVDTYKLNSSSDGISNDYNKRSDNALKFLHPGDKRITVDLPPPNTYIALNSIEAMEGSTVSFRIFGTKPGYFLCSLDGKPFTSCTSPVIYHGLSCGEHTFKVRAVDKHGTMDPIPAHYEWDLSAGTGDDNTC